MATNEELEQRMDKLEDQLNNVMEWLGKIEAELKLKANITHTHRRDWMPKVIGRVIVESDEQPKMPRWQTGLK